jgi:hypothetical protein
MCIQKQDLTACCCFGGKQEKTPTSQKLVLAPVKQLILFLWPNGIGGKWPVGSLK